MILSKNAQVIEKNEIGIHGLEIMGHDITVKARKPMDLHLHRDSIEMIVILKGSECYRIDDSLYNVSGGEVFITFQNQLHCNGKNQQGNSESIWFQISLHNEEDFLGLSEAHGLRLKQRLLELDVHILYADKQCLYLIRECFNSLIKQTNESQMYAQALFLSFLYRLLYIHNPSVKEDSIIIEIKKFVDDNIFMPLSMSDLSSMYNISLSSLKHKFKEYVGRPLRDYINYQKIEKAKELLLQGKSVTETAMALSFNTSDYFSVVFKKYTSISPSEFSQAKSS